MISVSGLSLRFGKKVLFDGVTLKFRPGLVYGIIGANGAGKTTFLKILSGEIKPTEGQIVLDPGVKFSAQTSQMLREVLPESTTPTDDVEADDTEFDTEVGQVDDDEIDDKDVPGSAGTR